MSPSVPAGLAAQASVPVFQPTSLPPLIQAPLRNLGPKQNPLSRKADFQRIHPRAPKTTLSGPIYTIWGEGALKPVMLQLIPHANLPDEVFSGIQYIEGDKASLAVPNTFVPSFLFSWVVKPDFLVLIIPRNAEQKVTEPPRAFTDFWQRYISVAYDIEGRLTRGTAPANDFMKQIFTQAA